MSKDVSKLEIIGFCTSYDETYHVTTVVLLTGSLRVVLALVIMELRVKVGLIRLLFT